MRLIIMATATALAVAGCAPTSYETAPPPPPAPVGIPAPTLPVVAPCPIIDGQQALCGRVMEKIFDPQNFTGDYLKLEVQLAGGNYATLETYGGDAQTLNAKVQAGNFVAYILEADGFLDADGLRVL